LWKTAFFGKTVKSCLTGWKGASRIRSYFLRQSVGSYMICRVNFSAETELHKDWQRKEGSWRGE
jgi:hypothetical protein